MNHFTPKARKKHALYEKWSTFNNMPDLNLSKLKLNGTTFRVYHYILYNMGYNNEILLNLTDCAKELEISRTNIHASVNTLIKEGIIKKLPKKVATLHYYQLNPLLMYRGDKNLFSNCLSNFLDLT